MGKASTRAQNRYIAKAYDRINLTVAKGKRDIIKAHAEAQGESVNGFINRAIDSQIFQDRREGPSEAAGAALGGGVVSLPSEAGKAVQDAAEAAGEAVPQFVTRAIESRAALDKRIGGKQK